MSIFFTNILNFVCAFSPYDLFAIYTTIIAPIFFFFCSIPLGNFFALLTLKVTEMKRLIFGKIWTPFWIFSIRCTLYTISTRLLLPNLKYWKKKLKGAIENSLLPHYICVPSSQWRPHQTLFYYKNQWFLEHVSNCLLRVYLYVWCLEGGFLR